METLESLPILVLGSRMEGAGDTGGLPGAETPTHIGSSLTSEGTEDRNAHSLLVDTDLGSLSVTGAAWPVERKD